MRQQRHLLPAATVLICAALLLTTCSSDSPTKSTNHAPAAPANATALGSPANDGTNISLTPTMHWTCTDPDSDELDYDIYFGTTATPPSVATRQPETSYSPDTLDYSTQYYWSVTARDHEGASTASDVWSFTTMAQPAEVISTPTTPTGPTTGFTGDNLEFTTGGSTSSYSHSVEYRFIWATGDTSTWSASTTATHLWPVDGTYAIRAQARCADDIAIVSNWSNSLSLTLSRPPTCLIEPASLNFDSVEVGQTRDLSFTITNDGGGILSGSVSESCPDFAIISGAGAYELSADQSVIVTVRFTPASEGVQNCTIETGAPCASDLSCTARGYRLPVCSLSTTTLDFGVVTEGEFSAAQSFTITNTGGGVLNFYVSYSCGFDFDIVSGGGARSLTAGQSLTVQVKFNPQSPGAKTCTLDMSNYACDGVTLTGTGQAPPSCFVTHNVLDFGGIKLGRCTAEQWFSVENTGGGTLTGIISEDCPDFEITSGGGAFSLTSGTTLYVQVRFCPQNLAYLTCTIDLGTNCSTDITCTGVGLPF